MVLAKPLLALTLLAAFVWVGARAASSARSDPTTTPGRVVKVLAASVHHVVGVFAVAFVALLAVTAVRYYLL